jgi:hypothetical protein
MSQTNARFQGGGVVLPVGAGAGNVNAGEGSMIIDTDGVLKTVDVAGVLRTAGIPNFNRLATKVPLLGDADATIGAAADMCSLYIMPAGTLTAPRTLTFTNAGQATGQIVQVLRLDQSANDLIIRNSTPTTLYSSTGSPGGALKLYQLFFNAGAWAANSIYYMQLT